MKWKAEFVVGLLVIAGLWLKGGSTLIGIDPVLLGHESYIGLWKANGSELKITKSGRMWFERKATQEFAGEQFFNMPITRIDDHEILGRHSDARLEVNDPPHKVGGHWVMNVNGISLIKE